MKNTGTEEHVISPELGTAVGVVMGRAQRRGAAGGPGSGVSRAGKLPVGEDQCVLKHLVF